MRAKYGKLIYARLLTLNGHNINQATFYLRAQHSMGGVDMKLDGKVAIVTGSGQGIGRAISFVFAREGANIVLNDVNVSTLTKTAEEICSLGREVLPVKADVSNSNDAKEMIRKSVEKFGKIDVLVNNAGIMRNAPIEQLSEDDWDAVMNVNLKGVFLCSKYVGQQMIEQKSGVIVNIASIAGLNPQIHTGAYSVSKAGVISLTELLAMEWAAYNIRVNAVCPGPTKTTLFESYWSGERREARKKAIPIGRFGEPEDIAKAALFLASDDASYLTGHTLVVDGGSSKCLYHLVDQIVEMA